MLREEKNSTPLEDGSFFISSAEEGDDAREENEKSPGRELGDKVAGIFDQIDAGKMSEQEARGMIESLVKVSFKKRKNGGR